MDRKKTIVESDEIDDLEQDMIDIPKVEILEIGEAIIKVRYDGKEHEVLLGSETSYVRTQAQVQKMNLDTRMALRQIAVLVPAIEHDEEVPREFWEPMILHEFRQQKYENAGLPEAHQLAIHDELLYISKYFSPDLRRRYLAFAARYRHQHQREELASDNENKFQKAKQQLESSGYRITREDRSFVYMAGHDTPILEIGIRKNPMEALMFGVFIRGKYKPTFSQNLLPKGCFYQDGAVTGIRSLNEALRIHDILRGSTKPWEIQLYARGFERDDSGRFFEKDFEKACPGCVLFIALKSRSAGEDILEIQADIKQKNAPSDLIDALKNQFPLSRCTFSNLAFNPTTHLSWGRLASFEIEDVLKFYRDRKKFLISHYQGVSGT